MKILFLHGWNSVPGGVKPTYLKDHGHIVFNPALDDDDFRAAVQTAQAVYDQQRPDVVVGSSRGGAVALNIQSGSTPLVLLCPAWKRWGTAKSVKSNALILHSRRDDVIPFTESEELIRNSGLPRDVLLEVGNDHRLADESSLGVMLWGCELLTSQEQLPMLDETLMAGTETSGDVTYICDACGEEIVIPLDRTEGTHQTYVEDCPVCCRANQIHITIDEDGTVQVAAQPEQDYEEH
ncbi:MULTISPECIES: CPXCG motif-containing cysteine-rich protein [unclassified Schlesneria]|uniref:CPXCG motif-containing cysteine-rich protein n=1 Tax=Schlesneria TaxID=656899 RepID=UPI0035A0D14A